MCQWRAGVVAAHRELLGHVDPADALGPAPKAGQAETYASWRAAWRALGRPEADRGRENRPVSCACAYDREQAWAPAFVANELAGTQQAAQRHRHDATLRAAEATAASGAATGDTGHTDRARLQAQAEQAVALADALDARAAELEAVDETRAHWDAHTAETRAAADRARAELSARQADDDPAAIEREVTADEWLDEHRTAVEAEGRRGQVTGDKRQHDRRRADPGLSRDRGR